MGAGGGRGCSAFVTPSYIVAGALCHPTQHPFISPPDEMIAKKIVRSHSSYWTARINFVARAKKKAFYLFLRQMSQERCDRERALSKKRCTMASIGVWSVKRPFDFDLWAEIRLSAKSEAKIFRENHFFDAFGNFVVSLKIFLKLSYHITIF